MTVLVYCQKCPCFKIQFQIIKRSIVKPLEENAKLQGLRTVFKISRQKLSLCQSKIIPKPSILFLNFLLIGYYI